MISTLYKKSLLLLVFFVGLLQAGAQENTTWQAYIKQSSDSADNNHYVYLYYSCGGKMQKIIHCLQYKNQKIVAINIGDSVFSEAVIKNPDLFKYIEDHIKNLKAVRTHQGKVFGKDQFRKAFEDPTKNFMQLGIRTEGLHFNHFQKTSPQFIAGLKNLKKAKGYQSINYIIDVMEKSAAQSGVEKN